MQKHIILIACGSRKATGPSPARNLYLGALFRKSLLYAESVHPDLILILSARHGILELSEAGSSI